MLAASARSGVIQELKAEVMLVVVEQLSAELSGIPGRHGCSLGPFTPLPVRPELRRSDAVRARAADAIWLSA